MDEVVNRITLALKIAQYNLEEQAKKAGKTDKRQGLELMKEAIKFETLRKNITKGKVKVEEVV